MRNGPKVYPGANSVIDRLGGIKNLAHADERERNSIATTLLTGGAGTRVLRHVANGDYLLVKRQPTLHLSPIHT